MQEQKDIRAILKQGYELVFTGDNRGNSYAMFLLQDRPLHIIDIEEVEGILTEFPVLLEKVQEEGTFLKVRYDRMVGGIESAIVKKHYEGPYNETVYEEVEDNLFVHSYGLMDGLSGLEEKINNCNRPLQKRKVV